MENLSRYQKAALVWLEQNPDRTLGNCLQKEKVTLETGEEVVLGGYVDRIRRIYQAMQKGEKYRAYRNLTEKEIIWWSEHGMRWTISHQKRDVKKYQEAALLWLERNPGKILSDCSRRQQVSLGNDEIVNLGVYICQIRGIYNAMQSGEHYQRYQDLTEEEIKWWSEHGMNWNFMRHTDLDYRKAALVWLKQHPDKTLTNCSQKEKVQLENGDIISLGTYLCQIRGIYNAMQRGGHYQKYQDLTEEEITWWSEHGMNWNFLRKRKNTNLMCSNCSYEHPEKQLLDISKESDFNDKINKITQYQLDELDIEESVLMTLRQEKNALLRKKYELMRGYIIDWNYYSEEEQLEIQKQNEFCDADMQFIQSMRDSIDELVCKVKMLGHK